MALVNKLNNNWSSLMMPMVVLWFIDCTTSLSKPYEFQGCQKTPKHKKNQSHPYIE